MLYPNRHFCSKNFAGINHAGYYRLFHYQEFDGDMVEYFSIAKSLVKGKKIVIYIKIIFRKHLTKSFLKFALRRTSSINSLNSFTDAVLLITNSQDLSVLRVFFVSLCNSFTLFSRTCTLFVKALIASIASERFLISLKASKFVSVPFPVSVDVWESNRSTSLSFSSGPSSRFFIGSF